MGDYVQRSSEIRRSFDKRSYFTKSAQSGWYAHHPVIYLNVEADNTNHSPVNK